jgi:hypothetical protein
MRQGRRNGAGRVDRDAAVARRCGRCLGAAEQCRKRQHQEGHQPGLGQIGCAPPDQRDRQLDQWRRDAAGDAVGRLHDRDRHAAAPHEISRQHRHEDDEAQAIGADGHDDAVEQDDLPQCGDEGAGEEPGDEQAAAEQQQAARAEPIDQEADQGRTRAGDQLRHRIGDRGLGPAPAEFGDEGDEIDRVGMHQRRAQRERGKGAAERQPGRAGLPLARIAVAHPERSFMSTCDRP